MIFVGDDWAEAHHDVCLMTETGEPLGYWKLLEGIEGIGRFHGLVANHVSDPSQVVVGIETDRGLWVDALVAGGYQVFGINPLSVARYRAQHHLSGAKSDRADAKLLADLVRTGRQNHRQVDGDSDVAEATRGVGTVASEPDLGTSAASQRSALETAGLLPPRSCTPHSAAAKGCRGGTRSGPDPRCGSPVDETPDQSSVEKGWPPTPLRTTR